MVRLTRDNQGYFDRLQRARSWIAKAQGVAGSPEGWDDLHAQFIFYWIALNALYGRGRAEQVSDIKDLHWFVDLVCDFDVSTWAIRTALEQVSRHAGRLLGEKFLFEPYWDMGTTPKVERMLQAERSSAVEALDDGDVATYLRLLVRRLRVARNQVFHGSSTDRSEKGRMSVRPAVSVLEVLVPTLADGRRASREGAFMAEHSVSTSELAPEPRLTLMHDVESAIGREGARLQVQNRPSVGDQMRQEV